MMLKIDEVLADLERHKAEHDMFQEYTPANRKLEEPHIGEFEVVISENDGRKFLVPEYGMHLHFLYRGQNAEFVPCVPSLYRGNASAAEVFWQRMRLVVFERMLQSHPVVKGFFERHGFMIDVEGLAQHYGIRTSILDLTSSVDVAMFFATCRYDAVRDVYDFYDDDEVHEGILYVFDPLRDNEPMPPFSMQNYMRGNITPIGLQAFPRPGLQEGYALHIPEGGSVKCWMYRFTFSSADSKFYYDKFNAGNGLWVKDRLVAITKRIAMQRVFSFEVFNETFKRFRPKGYSRNRMKQELMLLGVCLMPKVEDVVFSDTERMEIIREWNDGLGERVCSKIVRRRWFRHHGTNEKTGQFEGVHDECDFMTFEHLSESVFLHLIAYPDGPEGAEWVNYTDTPCPKVRIPEGTGVWKKIEACCNSVFGSPWLTEEDWRIEA